MKRILRILVNFAILVSLLLCAATVVLWVRSYYVRDRFHLIRLPSAPLPGDVPDPDLPLRMGRYNQLFINGYPGKLQLGHLDFDEVYLPPAAPGDLWDWGWHADKVIWNIDEIDRYTVSRFGFGVDWKTHWGLMEAERHVHALRLPFWFLTMVLGAMPAQRLRRYFRQAKFPHGRCPGCGYDLRATPDRCPECGNVPKKSAEA